jgi:hypothetical protein
LQRRRLLPFLQWCCNVWGEDGELRKNDNGVGSVGVFVYFRASPSSSLLFLFRFLSSYSLRSPLIQKFPPCSPFFLSPVTPSKLKKNCTSRPPSTVLVSLFSTFSQYLSSFQTSLYSFLPFSPISLLSFKLLYLLLSMLVFSSIYRANPCCYAWGAGDTGWGLPWAWLCRARLHCFLAMRFWVLGFGSSLRERENNVYTVLVFIYYFYLFYLWGSKMGYNTTIS